MKVLVCELCDGTDFVKQDGMFVCQGCGTKYTPQEAKKLMMDSPVEVHGTVKVDNSDELPKLLQAARNAREAAEAETAVKHYEKISAMDPNNWEALFYLVLLKTHTVKYGEIKNAAIQISNCLDRVFALIRDHVEDDEDRKNAVREIIMECNETAEWLVSVSHKYYQSISKNTGILAFSGISGLLSGMEMANDELQEEIDRCVAIAKILYYCGTAVEEYFGLEDSDYRECATVAWKMMLTFNTEFRETNNSDLFNTEFLRTWTSRVNELDNMDEESEENKMAVLTIYRNQTALLSKPSKMNRLVCIMANGDEYEIGLDETATIRVPYGPNKITFDFWGKALVPAKNKCTPDFVVEGDMYIELTPDPTWGGFKTTIQK